MNDAVRLILSLSLSGTILAILVFMAKPFIRHRLPKSVQYYIWVIVILRLIIPFSSEKSIMNGMFYGKKISGISDYHSILLPNDDIDTGSVSSFIFPNVQRNVANGIYKDDTDHSRYLMDLFGQYIFYIWLLGVMVALTVNLSGYARFSRHLKRSSRPATGDENFMLLHLLNGLSNVRLVRNSLVTTPMLIGIVRPCIVIPDVDYDEGRLKNILLHEISHLRRFDIVVKWLTMLATSIHWCNPLVYFIKKEINHACELACDEAVIKNLSALEKQEYGDTLISVVSENKYPIGVLQATMSEQKETLKERLVAIMKYNKKSKSLILLSIVLLIVVSGGAVFLGAYSGNTFNEKAVVSVVEEFGSKLQTVSLQAPKDLVVKSIQDNYAPYATKALLDKWISDPTKAPGRLVSSPWPERIEILNVKRLSDNKYEVKGNVIEITSVEKVQGGVAVKRAITLIVKKVDGHWLVDDVAMGEYISGSNGTENDLQQVAVFALEVINRDIEHYESIPEVDIIDSKITRLELVETFDALADTPIYVYALEYRLLPKDLSKVIMAGGMQADEEGWLMETCSMGSPLLVVTRSNGEVRLIGILWTGGVIEEGGLENSLKELLERN